MSTECATSTVLVLAHKGELNFFSVGKEHRRQYRINMTAMFLSRYNQFAVIALFSLLVVVSSVRVVRDKVNRYNQPDNTGEPRWSMRHSSNLISDSDLVHNKNIGALHKMETISKK